MLISACDSADPPARSASPSTSPADSAALAANADKAQLESEAQAAFQAEIQLPKSPESEPHAQAERLTPAGQAQPNPAEKTVKPKVSSPSVAREETPIPHVALDLSVPKELLKTLQPSDAPDDLDRTLLPPMFIERDEENPFQLNGRLITKDRQDVIEGAELQFQFKR